MNLVYKAKDDFQNYADYMVSKGFNEWAIGWESLTKYINHKIYNQQTKKVAVVHWSEEQSFFLTDSTTGEDISLSCSDFRHEKGLWICRADETY